MVEVEIKREGEFQYIEKGKGSTILVLHGLFGALSNFKGVFKDFTSRFKVIIPILPIYSMPVLDTTVKSLARFVHRFIEFKNLKDICLLGNSLGGHVALVYATEHQPVLSSMVLTGSSGLYENAFGGSYPRKGDKSYLRDKIAVTFYDPDIVTDELVDECFNAVNDRSKLVRILALAKSAIRHNMKKELPSLKTPTCLIWGKEDKITPPEVAVEFQTQLPKADLYWIDHCGHAPMMEHPERFNQIMSHWLEKQREKS